MKKQKKALHWIASQELKDFDLLFCTGEAALSRAIMAATGSRFSHVAHVRYTPAGELRIIDAQRDGYNPKTLEDWIAEYNYDVELVRDERLTDELKQQYAAREFDLIGKEYDVKGLAFLQPHRIVVSKINKFVRRSRPLPEQKDPAKRVYCSEVQAIIRGFAVVDLSPEELYNECVTLRKYSVIKK